MEFYFEGTIRLRGCNEPTGLRLIDFEWVKLTVGRTLAEIKCIYDTGWVRDENPSMWIIRRKITEESKEEEIHK